MTFEKVVEAGNGLLLAMVVSREDERKGRRPVPLDGVHFITSDDLPQQVAVVRHPSGHVVPAHTHRVRLREVVLTQEVLLVHSGSMTVMFYDTQGRYVTSRTLKAGDVAVLIRGGHSLTVLDPVEFVEVKQGPYEGREADKVELPNYDPNDRVA